jgi:hypothetical protein
MSQWFSELGAAFTPPSDAWWFAPLAWGVTGILLVLLAAALWPRRLAAPVTTLERRLARLPAAGRCAAALAVPAVALAVPAAVVLLAFGPRRPCVIVLSDHTLPDAPGFWERRGPDGWGRVDAGPLVDRVLARAEAEGCSGWVAGTPAERARLRHLCVDELLRHGAGGSAPAAAPSGAVPAWVRLSAEMTVVAGLARCLENPTWVGLRVRRPRPGRGWDRAAPLVARPHTPWELFPEGDPHRPVVRFLLDGRALDQNRRVQFQALVETPPDFTGKRVVSFAVADPVTGRTRTIERPLKGKAAWESVAVDEAVGGFGAAARLVATAEAGAVRTPLTPAFGPGRAETFRVAVLADPASFAGLHDLWQGALGATPSGGKPANPLRANCHARGLIVPELVATGGPADPVFQVVPGGRGILVLAPGLSPAEVPPAVLADGPATPLVPFRKDPAQPAETVRVFGYRVSRVAGAPTLDSLMSIPADRTDPPNWADAADPDRIPRAAPGMEAFAFGVRINSPLEVGREQRDDDTTRSVLEVGRVGLKPFVLLRLNLEGQLLTADRFAPGRARSFVAALVWAANHVLTAGRPADPAAARERHEGPEAAPLLTAEDEERLLDLGRRSGDGLGLGLIGAFLAALTIYAWLWARPAKQEGES